MKKFPLVMDSFHFEIRYNYGNLYFDRCGQCLNDIERSCEGWYVSSVDPSKGLLERPDKSFTSNFNYERFNFSSLKPSNTDIKTIATEVSTLWKIIEANLGLEEYTRQGCRFYYLIGTTSLEDAERLLEKSSLNLTIPSQLTKSGFERKNTNVTIVFAHDNFEYRLNLTTMTRYEAMNPNNLIRTDPRLLSTRQKQIRLAQLQRLSEYSANPMYAVCLDVDCYEIMPERISIEEFIVKQTDIVQSDFLPLLGKL